MKKRMQWRFWVGLLVLLPAVALAKTVVVTGEALIQDGDHPKARQAALNDAFATAVTQVLGAYLSAESYTRNFESLERGVYSKTRGYVRRYEVLDQSERDGVLSLKVRVDVAEEGLRDDLTTLGVVLDAMRNPTVGVQSREEGMSRPVSDRLLREALAARGFRVVEGGEPDVLIRIAGSVANRSQVGGVGLHAVVVRVDGRALWRESGRVIAGDQVTVNAAGPTEQDALRQAYSDAARKLTPRLVDAMAERWRQELSQGRLIRVVAVAPSYRAARLFGSRLGKVFGIKRKTLDEYNDQEAHLTVRFNGDAGLLAELIERNDFRPLTVRVLSVHEGAVKVHVAE